MHMLHHQSALLECLNSILMHRFYVDPIAVFTCSDGRSSVLLLQPQSHYRCCSFSFNMFGVEFDPSACRKVFQFVACSYPNRPRLDPLIHRVHPTGWICRAMTCRMKMTMIWKSNVSWDNSCRSINNFRSHNRSFELCEQDVLSPSRGTSMGLQFSFGSIRNGVCDD